MGHDLHGAGNMRRGTGGGGSKIVKESGGRKMWILREWSEGFREVIVTVYSGSSK